MDKHFQEVFRKANKDTRLWIQDGDPSQNSRLAKKAMKRAARMQLLQIPPEVQTSILLRIFSSLYLKPYEDKL